MSDNKGQITNVSPLPDANARPTKQEAKPPTPREHIVKRNVVVIMPFGSGDSKTERQSILDVMRIKYIVENHVHVVPEGSLEDGPRIEYNVEVFREPVGSIPEDAIDTVADADVVIALLTEMNVNVIYELAVRNLLKDEPILIVTDKSKERIPVYLKDVAFIDYDHPTTQAITKQIEWLSASIKAAPSLNWKKLDAIPDQLRETIDDPDNQYFKSEIQDALQKTEQPRQPPHFLRKHVIDLDPGNVLKTWVTYTPFSVVRIKWQRKRTPTQYDPADMIGEPVIYAANDDYIKLFGLKLRDVPDPDGPRALTVAALLDRLKPYIEPAHYDKFANDQTRLIKEIIFNDGVGQAQVPIQFNDRHPARVHRNRAYLPDLLGKRIVGDDQSPHIVFLAVAFVEQFERMGPSTH